MATQMTDRLGGITGDYAIKTPVKVATTAAITLSGAQTIDGIAVSANTSPTPPDRVLVKNQSDQTTNGIYDVQSGTWARAKDFDGARDAKTGTLVYVVSGSTNGGHLFKCTSADPTRIGTDAITFADASVTGPAGADGAPGADGADGAAGADGATGATGATGAGANIIVTDGSTTVNPASTLRLGSGFTVTDNGSGEAQVDGGGSGGSLVKVEQHIASASSTIDFTTGLTGTYAVYMVVLDRVVPSTQTDLLLQVSTDGGSTWITGSSYDWAIPSGAFANGPLTLGGSGTIGDSRFTMAGGFDSSGLTMQGYIYGTQDSGIHKTLNMDGMFVSGGTSIWNTFFGRWKQNTVVNGLRFKPASGNFTSGTFTLYGIVT